MKKFSFGRISINENFDLPSKRDHLRALSLCMDEKKARDTSIRLQLKEKEGGGNLVKNESSEYQIEKVIKGFTRNAGSSKTIPIKNIPEKLSELKFDISTAPLHPDILQISPKDMNLKKPIVHASMRHPFIRRNNPVINISR